MVTKAAKVKKILKKNVTKATKITFEEDTVSDTSVIIVKVDLITMNNGHLSSAVGNVRLRKSFVWRTLWL